MRLFLASAALVLWTLPLQAEEKVERLLQALQLDEIIEILQDEGDVMGQTLQETFLDNNGGQVFQNQVDRIYDANRMRSQVAEVFDQTLTQRELDRAILFYESDLGQAIVSLEITARIAMADETIEEMAQDTYENGDRDTEFYKLVDEYIQINNLIDENVQNSISADYNFFRGMDLGGEVDDAELLAQLLTQKDSITDETQTWLYSFFLLAYQPLSDAQIRENIAFSRTETGRAINDALFQSFDWMFDTIYFELGQAVGLVLKGSDL
jgi:DNA-binding transcriptional regulator GbsR (MarR family)